MAARTTRRTDLEQAMALLIQNQATFVAEMVDIRRDMAKIWRDIEEIKAILIRHEHILANLTDAIREKIVFKPNAR